MRATLLALPLALCAGSALADEGDDLLAKVDKAISNFTDQRIVFEVQNLKPGTSEPQGMRFKTVVKGGKTLTQFEAPGDVKGTRVLTTSSSQMWVFIPEFNKIRKIASHSLAQGFMGTTLSQQDMGTTSYGLDYDASLQTKDAASYTLDLLARDPSTVGYPHLRMTVDAAKNVPLKIEYLGEDGAVLRTQTRSDYDCITPDYCMFGVMKMVDHTRGDAWTTLTPVSKDIDTGVDDAIFTPRTLQLGF